MLNRKRQWSTSDWNAQKKKELEMQRTKSKFRVIRPERLTFTDFHDYVVKVNSPLHRQQTAKYFTQQRFFRNSSQIKLPELL